MVDEQNIRELCQRIVQEFQPERIILFGSYACGNPTPDSDVDLLVVLPFEGKNFWKSLEIGCDPLIVDNIIIAWYIPFTNRR